MMVVAVQNPSTLKLSSVDFQFPEVLLNEAGANLRVEVEEKSSNGGFKSLDFSVNCFLDLFNFDLVDTTFNFTREVNNKWTVEQNSTNY
jgi:hypothetical protein